MRLHRFFIEEQIAGRAKIHISNEEILHQWKKVFRLSARDKVVLFDGSGKEYTCTIDMLSKERADISVGASREVPPVARDIWLCVALIKKDNFEWVIEKGTELGVSNFVPIMAERSEKKALNMGRLQKIAREASEQSGRGTLPTIHDTMTLEDAAALALMPARKISFDPTGTKLSEKEIKSTDPVALFIGPEGGWSEKELEFFREQKVEIKSLGTQILRAETAAISGAILFLIAQ